MLPDYMLLTEESDAVTKTFVGVRSCMKGARKKARLAGVTFGVSVPKQNPPKKKRIVDVPSVCAKLAKLVVRRRIINLKY